MGARPVIAFTGLIAAGKTTAATRLVENHGFCRIRFSGPLKDMARAIGLSWDEIDGPIREKPCALLGGQTPRFFLQALGTEFGRDIIDRDLWVRAWRRAVDEVPPGAGIVVDDVRFPNEAAAVHAASPFSLVVRISRAQGNQPHRGSHVSELQAFPADLEIHNDGSVEALLAAVDDLVLPSACF